MTGASARAATATIAETIAALQTAMTSRRADEKTVRRICNLAWIGVRRK